VQSRQLLRLLLGFDVQHGGRDDLWGGRGGLCHLRSGACRYVRGVGGLPLRRQRRLWSGHQLCLGELRL
jgi:hypothetical protein